MTRNPPDLDPSAWEAFKAYNARDVEVELAIHQRLVAFPMPESEWDTYAFDQQINDTGILLDATLVDNAVECDRQHRTTTLARAQEVTGLENPNSPIQLKEWLAISGCHMTSLTKTETTTASVEEIYDLMATAPDWTLGLPLVADGYECEFYRKD